MSEQFEASDRELMLGLIGMVSKAAEGQVETTVTTFISRPMWNAWCRAVGEPEGIEPTKWLGLDKTRRVYGSRTVVVESGGMFAVSMKAL